VQVPGSVYFCDVIDNQLLGLWYSAIKRDTDVSENEWSMSMSHWEVFSTAGDVLVSPLTTALWRSPESNNNQNEILKSVPVPRFKTTRGGLGKRVFSIRNRLDAWSLLDWKSFSVYPDGTLEMFDFCPESTNKSLAVQIEDDSSMSDKLVPFSPLTIFTPTTSN